MSSGAGDAAPAAFAYDYNTLFDMIEGAIEGERAKWKIGVTLDSDRQHTVEAIKGDPSKPSTFRLRVPVQGLDFDRAAAALGERLRERKLIP